MSRTLLVATSSAGLVLGGALSASAGERDGGHYGKHHGYWAKGWLTVCQTVKNDYRDPWRDGKDDKGDWNDTKHKSGFDDRSSTIDSRYRYGNDYHRWNLEGRYLIRDSRGKGYLVTLKGRSDCASVRVNTGWAKVSVIHRPDNTWLKGDSNRWVKVKKYDRAYVSFLFEAKKYSHHDGPRR